MLGENSRGIIKMNYTNYNSVGDKKLAMGERPDELIATMPKKPETVSDRFTAAREMDKRQFNPIVKMMDLHDRLEECSDDSGMPLFVKERFAILSTLSKFYCPQPKSIDVQVQTDNKFTIEAVSFAQLVEERKAFIPQQSVYTGPQLADVIDVSVNSGAGRED